MEQLCYIVLYGSPIDGYKAHGPFPSATKASEWAETQGEGGEYIMQVHAPGSTTRLYTWG